MFDEDDYLSDLDFDSLREAKSFVDSYINNTLEEWFKKYNKKQEDDEY